MESKPLVHKVLCEGRMKEDGLKVDVIVNCGFNPGNLASLNVAAEVDSSSL